jgi:hypothetical protein
VFAFPLHHHQALVATRFGQSTILSVIEVRFAHLVESRFPSVDGNTLFDDLVEADMLLLALRRSFGLPGASSSTKVIILSAGWL